MSKTPKIPEEQIEEVVWKEIEFTCPVRGKVKQKVKVTVLKSVTPEVKNVMRTGDPMIDDFEISSLNSMDEEGPSEEYND